MREICHKGLARLVGVYGSVRVQKKLLPELLNASVEPDLENRQKIEGSLEIIYKVIPTLSKWYYEHTIGAKETAISNLKNAHYALIKGDQAWISFLGHALHFIADWGTPYHSPFSLVDTVIPITVMGGIGIGIFGLIVNLLNESDEIFENTTKWGLLGAAASGGISLIYQYFEHKNFEEQCDEYWDSYENIIIQKFTSIKNHFQFPKDFEDAVEIFEKMMNDLRNISKNTVPDWILQNNGYNFSDYMVQIALVMDFAVRIISYC